ncbi:MAG TPA: S41 family peptidase [Longimicrobiales bacterium]|nr:S41 family peptidase [Longimicrobiales bacterium]
MPKSPFRSGPLAAVLLTLVLATPASADPIRFMRDPHISHGRMVFSYQGDIWIARDDGTDGRRLTTHIARDALPRFSPDGRHVAFTSNRMGNADVWVVPADGGEPRQLTFYTGHDLVQYWTPDGSGIVFVTSRGTDPFATPLHIVPVEGGQPTPMGMDMAMAGMIRQDGAMVAFNRLRANDTRKGYRGNLSADVWVQDLRTGSFTQLTDTDLRAFREHVQDASPMWGADGKIYFVSERDGTWNLWRTAPDGGALEQVTRYASGGVKYPAISPDGTAIIYTQEHELHVLEVPGGQARKVPVELAFEPQDSRLEWIPFENRAEGFAPSPTGDYLAVDARGEIFIVPTDPKVGEKTQVTRSPRRERNQRFSPDGRALAYVSDASGEEEIWVYDVAAATHRKLTDHPSAKSDFAWAPDGSRIAFEAANRLFEVDVRSARTTELGHNPAGGYNLIEYAPDGRWLLYTRADASLNTDVRLLEIATRREHNVTPNPFREYGARLTPDGRTLVFTSNRAGETHLFRASLERLAADPDDPLVRARLRDAKADSAAAGAAQLRVDVGGIDARAVQLTRGGNGVGAFFLSKDGRTVFFASRDDDGPALFSVGIDGEDRKKVTSGTFQGLTPTADGKAAFFREQGPGGGGQAGAEIHRLSLPDGKKKRVDFTFPVQVDHRAEWAQIFDESWRVMRDRFYDEDMHGVDWAAARAAYEPLLQHVGTYEDAYDLANHMIGELNASHVGVRGPPSREMPSGYASRYLGFELEPADGRYRIAHIYRDGPADREWLGLSVGDFVLAIDGQELAAGDNYWRVLNHTLNEYVPVRVARTASGQDARELRIRSVESVTNLRYEDWVERNRDFVEEESGGRIAYVHIRSMNQPSLVRFQNEIDRFWDRQGIVVDIRFNGGGNIDQQLIDILERRPYEYWNSRWGGPTWGRRPRQAIAGPKVMLINARSGSDSEVTPMGFRDLGLGRIVGNPTMGAVIATGSYRLINGATIRTPGSLVVTYDPTKPHNVGINLENYGVAPDVWVENAPEDNLRGYDRELKAAVDEALRMLREGTWQYTEEGANGGR